MTVWWVNHKQTYKQETDGGYIWSPKTNKDGGKNVSYDNLTYCREGDLIFSFANKLISNIGVIEEEAIPTKRPEEFGKLKINMKKKAQKMLNRCLISIT